MLLGAFFTDDICTATAIRELVMKETHVIYLMYIHNQQSIL